MTVGIFLIIEVVDTNGEQDSELNSMPCADINVERTEEVGDDEYPDLMSATGNPNMNQVVAEEKLIEKKNRKRKNGGENDKQDESSGFTDKFLSPPSSRLRSRSRQ